MRFEQLTDAAKQVLHLRSLRVPLALGLGIPRSQASSAAAMHAHQFTLGGTAASRSITHNPRPE
jgi:hypothetical protein